MAATAMTMRSNVAKMGDMAFLEFNILLIDIFIRILIFWFERWRFCYLTRMKTESTFGITVHGLALAGNPCVRNALRFFTATIATRKTIRMIGTPKRFSGMTSGKTWMPDESLSAEAAG